jgi:hypothetical protein
MLQNLNYKTLFSSSLENMFEELEDRMPYMTHPVTMILYFWFMACAGGGQARQQQNAESSKDAWYWKHQAQRKPALPTCNTRESQTVPTCLNVNKGFSLVEQLWPKLLEEARAINGEGDRGHEAGDAGLVGLSHIKLSWCWLLICWDWFWLKLSCLRRWKRLTSSRTFAKICSKVE